MKIIAFGGLAKAGKTTAAHAAGKALFELGYHPVPERFAGPLKDSATLCGFHKGGDTDDLYRTFTQWTGTLGRERYEDWWVKRMEDRLDVIAREGQDALSISADDGTPWHERVVIIDDLRFANEIGMVSKYSGKNIFVSAARRLPDMTAAWRSHPSEIMAMDYEMGVLPDETFDFTVSNNDPTGQAAFESTVATLVKSLVADAREEG